MILLTGVTGFIGSEVFARLIKSGVAVEKILLLVRKTPEQNSIFYKRLQLHGVSFTQEPRWVVTDFLNQQSFYKTLQQLPVGVKQVCHLAAQIKTGKGQSEQQARMNEGVTKDLLDWSAERGVEHFVYASSVVAFGGSFTPRLRNEDDFENAWEPFCETLDYFRSKRRAHEFVMKEARIPATLICPGIVHGALESGKDSRGHLKKYVEGRLTVTPPAGGNIVGLDRVANCFVEALQAKPSHKIFVKLAVDQNWTYDEYFKKYVTLAVSLEASKKLKRLSSGMGVILRSVWRFCHFFGLKKLFDLHSLEGAVASTLYLWFESKTEFTKNQSVDNSLRDSLKFR